MDPNEAAALAQSWLEAWNAHDVEAVLAHFHDDVEFTSPVAARLVPDSGGRIHGKAALRAYWEEGLRRLPDLHFELEGLYLGVDTLVIHYRDERGGVVAEGLRFGDGPLAIEGHAAYGA